MNHSTPPDPAIDFCETVLATLDNAIASRTDPVQLANLQSYRTAIQRWYDLMCNNTDRTDRLLLLTQVIGICEEFMKDDSISDDIQDLPACSLRSPKKLETNCSKIGKQLRETTKPYLDRFPG